MFGSIIRHRLPVIPIASLLDNQPRSYIRVKDTACLSSPKKERAKDEKRREEETSRRRKRKRKRSKRHESSERNEPKPMDRNHRGHHRHGKGERVVRIPGGPELVVPHGVTYYRVVHEGCRYKLLLNPETGKLRNFSMKKIQNYR